MGCGRDAKVPDAASNYTSAYENPGYVTAPSRALNRVASSRSYLAYERDIAFVTRGIIMKSSNLAERLDLIEPAASPTAELRLALRVIANDAIANVRPARPRRALFATRAIVIRDQGFRLFRVR